MPIVVRFSPEAEHQIVSLHDYLAIEASPRIASRYIESILDFCRELTSFPMRGVPREDIRPKLRTVSFRKRVLVAYTVDDGQVLVLGIYYGGQDYESIVRELDC
jgi:plasmid stabilization system protein ParE